METCDDYDLLGLYSKGLHDQRQEDRASIYGSYSPHVQETLPK